MTMALRILWISFLVTYAVTGSTGIFYEEISETNGNTIIEGSMQRTPIIHKSFHECSIIEYCNYVIKNMTNGSFTLYNSEGKLPQNRTGLRLWKKIYYGSFGSCREAYNRGSKQDGIFTVIVPSFGLSQVRCDMTTAPNGWLVFQRRVDGTVNFYRNWVDYKNGFGDLNGNFWLGLDKLHQLAGPGKGATLRVDLKHMDLPGQLKYAEYSLFEVSNESDGYKLTVGGYSGNAEDQLKFHSNKKFSTKDRDNDVSVDIHCAVKMAGGFWYSACYAANLNGEYPPDANTYQKYISWVSMPLKFGRITFCEMKLRI